MFRKIIKKLNNFRFTALLMSCISGLAGIYSLVSFFLYHFAGDLEEVPPDEETEYLARIVGFSSRPYLGMILFFMAVATLIISILVVYSLVPYLKNKEKLTPRKSLLITGFVSAFTQLGLLILMIVLVATETPNTAVGIYLTLPLGVLSIIGLALYIIPYLKCDFYMPEIK